MNINDINVSLNNPIRTGSLLNVGEFNLNEGELKFSKSENLTNEEYKCSYGRVYLIAVDCEIYKIGGSAAKGGIKQTIGGYLTGKKGSPGESRFALNTLITEMIEQDKIVSVHMIICPETYVRINGLRTKGKMVPVFAFKEIENLCLLDFQEINNGEKPTWNFKERNVSYPKEIREAFAKYKSRNAK